MKGEVGDKGQEQRLEEGDPSEGEKGASLARQFLLEAWILLALGRYALCCDCAKWS